MFATRVRNPQARLLKDVQNFERNPEARAAHIVKIGRQEGYDFIRAAAIGLVHAYAGAHHYKGKKMLHFAALLCQPDWEFYASNEEGKLLLVVDDTTIGTYTLGEGETGSVEISNTITIIRGEKAADPRDAFVSSRIKQKVYKQKRSYYLIDVARDRSCLRYFYPDDKIQSTKGNWYLKKYAGYVITAGPFDTRDEAADAKVTIIREKVHA